MKEYYRDSVMEVDLDKVRNNAKIIRNDLAKNKFMYAVVKGNGCGIGILDLTRIVIEEKSDGIAVATLDEGLLIRKYYSNIPILMMGAIRRCDIVDSAQNNIIITIPNLEFAEYLSAVELEEKIKVHIKVNTGMNRLGVNNIEDVNKIIDLLKKNNNIEIEGIYTHFATSDYTNDSQKQYYENQVKQFKDILEQVNYPFKQIHCTNSSALLRFSSELSEFTNTVRLLGAFVGIIDDQSQIDKGIVPVINVKSRISQVGQYPKGSLIGYSNGYQITKDNVYIAVIPIGYADGIDRLLSGTKVRCNGQYGKIVGRVCMDQTFLEFDNPVYIEEEVVLVDCEDSDLDLFQRSKELGINAAAFLERFTIRLPKIYYENNEIVRVDNLLLNQ